MSELPPPRVRGQRSGKCRTCKGAIRFYPRPLAGAENLLGEPPAGMWAHLDRGDWQLNPHEPVPEED